ncbi:inositol 2-dehydrogenase [Chromatiales bacterium (ex Bugula neritina AB1)]|nr:inositol 2-dehydrogenase [Chromatiales bacterium (ex Bugula neritina AB1)]
MKQFALIGAGRIGKVHAIAINSVANARIKSVCDVHEPSATALAAQYGADVASIDSVFSDAGIDAVLIASATDTHTPLLKRCAEAGKPVFCEKPLDLNLATAREAAQAIDQSGIVCGMGFNRRFDPQFSRLQQRVANGDIGNLETLIITSRDPAPPPIDYINVSGGLFRDMMIHDFDIARWVLDEPIHSLYATGSCLVDEAIGSAGDIDTASVTLRTASGKIVVITNSRRAVYGYDQRIEAFGSQGMLQAMNNSETNLVFSSGAGVVSEPPLHFFLERYADAYRIELEDFINALQNGSKPLADHNDGVASLQLAEAANASLQSGAAVDVENF